MPIYSNFIATARGRDPCSVHCTGKYGHGVGMSMFSLAGPTIPSLLLFFGELGPLATTLHNAISLVVLLLREQRAEVG